MQITSIEHGQDLCFFYVFFWGDRNHVGKCWPIQPLDLLDACPFCQGTIKWTFQSNPGIEDRSLGRWSAVSKHGSRVKLQSLETARILAATASWQGYGTTQWMRTRSWGLRRASSQLMQASVLGDCLSILEASKIRLSMTIPSHEILVGWKRFLYLRLRVIPYEN